MRRSKWLLLSLVVIVIGGLIFRIYSNQIVSIAIYKPDGINGLKHIVTIPRDKERKAFIRSLERSFAHQHHADPKADALIDKGERYFRFEVKKRIGSETLDLWVTQQKIVVQTRNKFTKVEGKYIEAINEFLNGL
ncbi:hypothetical protein QFZ81_003899 [Paenibacillus sp. V4I9]|uniref:hypothetical protein n=1 Tax=Paenibacillus sp. V4I9 TaxID=3042308 RepID=UPI002782BEA5|nr:hypothetical protein [Paenibacillus sp. V4I9]MDQ0888811.1 hypothetical protein [Paenibacillus sp. V4I9]